MAFERVGGVSDGISGVDDDGVEDGCALVVVVVVVMVMVMVVVVQKVRGDGAFKFATATIAVAIAAVGSHLGDIDAHNSGEFIIIIIIIARGGRSIEGGGR